MSVSPLTPGPLFWATDSFGVEVFLDPQVSMAGHVSSLTGATCTLIAIDPGGTRRTFSADPTSDGTQAIYTITLGDWPTAGLYQCQWQAAFEGGPTILSQVFLIRVGAAL